MPVAKKKLLLTALLLSPLAASCDTPATPDPAVVTAAPVTSITPSAPQASVPTGAPIAAGSSKANEALGLPHARGPIPGISADSIARAWAERWHATPTPYSQLGFHASKLTVDFAPAHSKLFMTVGRQSATAAAATTIYCEVTDASLRPRGFIKMTRNTVDQLVTACPGPALKAKEKKQVVDFATSHNRPDTSTPCRLPDADGKCEWSDHRIDLGRFQLVVQTSSGQFRLWVLGRKNTT